MAIGSPTICGSRSAPWARSARSAGGGSWGWNWTWATCRVVPACSSSLTVSVTAPASPIKGALRRACQCRSRLPAPLRRPWAPAPLSVAPGTHPRSEGCSTTATRPRGASGPRSIRSSWTRRDGAADGRAGLSCGRAAAAPQSSRPAVAVSGARLTTPRRGPATSATASASASVWAGCWARPRGPDGRPRGPRRVRRGVAGVVGGEATAWDRAHRCGDGADVPARVEVATAEL